MTTLAQEVASIAARLAQAERRLENMFRHGTVHEVDAEKQICRLKVAKDSDGTDQIGPWVPYGQIAGALKLHSPPSVGQQMTMISPSGDLRQAVALPLTWSEQNPSPNDKKDEHELTFSGWDFKLTKDTWTVKKGSTEITVTADKITLKSNLIETDGPTHLDKGNRKIHYVGGLDSDGDAAVDGANRAFV